MSEKTGVNSALGITPKTEDFIEEAATSDMLEIDAAKVAEQKGDAEEKKFAEQMITDHTKTNTELKELVPSDVKSAVPTSLDESPRRSSTSSRTPSRKTSPAKENFAGEYDPMQVSAHKDAVSLFEAAFEAAAAAASLAIRDGHEVHVSVPGCGEDQAA